MVHARPFYLGAPLLVAFIAAAASIGGPERILGVIAALGITLHIVGLRLYRWRLRRALTAPKAPAFAEDKSPQETLDDLREWHLAHAYLLGALKLRANDDATRQLAAEAEDAAQGALALLNHMTAREQTCETAAEVSTAA